MMLSSSSLRTVWAATRISATRGRVLPRAVVRYNSSSSEQDPTPKEQLKAAIEQKDWLQKDWKAPVLTYEQVKLKAEQPPPIVCLIDVREPDEVLQGSIPSSVNIPLSTLSADFHLNDDVFLSKYGFPKPDKGQELVFYCRSGMRSASAADVAKRNGYTNVFNYIGSWLDWTKRQGPQGNA